MDWLKRGQARKTVIRLCLLCFVVIFGVTNSWAQSNPVPIPGLFGTAFDGLGRQLSDRSVDPHYALISSPLQSVQTVASGAAWPTFVSDSTKYPLSLNAWPGNSSTSKWIAPYADQTAQAPNGSLPSGEYVFQTKFNLLGYDPSTARIEGRWISDNKGEIWVNGVLMAQNNDLSGFANFTLPPPPTAPLGAGLAQTTGFLPGENVIEFRVNNSAASPVGLRVEITKSEVQLLPEPTSAALLGGAMFGLFTLIRRRHAR